MATRQHRNSGRRLAPQRSPKQSKARDFPQFRTCLRKADPLPTIWDVDRLLMEEALRRFDTKTAAAQAIGLTREGFRKKILRMGLK